MKEQLEALLKEAEAQKRYWEHVCTCLTGALVEFDMPADIVPEAPAPNGPAPVRNGTIIGDIMHVLRDGKETDLMDLQQEVDFKRGEPTKISGVLSTETNKPKAERRVERTGPGMYRLAGQ